jgi:hypothetical protein
MTVVVVVGASVDTVEQLASHGVQTVLDLRSSDLDPVRRWVTTSGLGYRRIGPDLDSVMPLVSSSSTALLCPDRRIAEHWADRLSRRQIKVTELVGGFLVPFQRPLSR